MLPKPNDKKPYEDETLEKIQFEHLIIAVIILEVGTIISILVFLGEMAWFARRLKKIGMEEAMPNNIEMTDNDDNAMDDDDDIYTMDEQKYAAWKKGCRFSIVFCISVLLFLISVLIFHITLLINAK